MNARLLLLPLGVLKRVHSRPITSVYTTAVRSRSSYFQDNQKAFVPRFIRAYVYRHPKVPYAVILIVLSLAATQPYWKVWYARFAMERPDYLDFRREHNIISLNRGRYGEDLYIPFYSSDKTDGLYDYYMRKSCARRAGLPPEEVPRSTKPPNDEEPAKEPKTSI